MAGSGPLVDGREAGGGTSLFKKSLLPLIRRDCEGEGVEGAGGVPAPGRTGEGAGGASGGGVPRRESSLFSELEAKIRVSTLEVSGEDRS